VPLGSPIKIVFFFLFSFFFFFYSSENSLNSINWRQIYLFPSQIPSIKTSLFLIKKNKMGMVNNIRGLMMVVSMAVYLTSVGNVASQDGPKEE
jgi:hypothetical protein